MWNSYENFPSRKICVILRRERKKALAFSEGVSLVNECLARKLVSLVDKEESAGDTPPPGLWIRKERENPGCLLHE
jgi:hypothetical protein